ncbi:hypothetical protein HRG_012214 [Hirsutella rhossiliensis]
MPLAASSEAGGSLEQDTSKESPIAETNAYHVSWNGDGDPSNPMKWSARARWGWLGLIGLVDFVTCLSSYMLSPALSDLIVGLGSSNSTLSSLAVSIYFAEFALGPLLAAPLSELYGRFVVVRFLSGCVGIPPAALFGGSTRESKQCSQHSSKYIN